MALAASTIQKTSWRPPGAMSHASTNAAAKVNAVTPHASPIVMRPLGSGRFGLFTRSISRS